MSDRTKKFDEVLNRFANETFHKILYVDFTADTFEILSVNDDEWNRRDKEQPSKKISEWFNWFVNSPFCYENDRERLKEFTNIESIKTALTEKNSDSISIVYRRKFSIADVMFSTVSMDIFPAEAKDNHIAAYIFVRNITREIQKYNSSIEEEVEHHGIVSGKRQVLIVEDDELNREILSEILSDYETLEASNGAEGLEILQENMMKISAVILDVQMPVMNGYDFLRHVKQDPFLSKIPIIVATGTSSAEEKVCLSLGAADFVPKPYDADIIKCRLASIIRLRESAATMSILQTDDYTGLLNLQAFYYQVKQILSHEPNKNWSFIVFDIDHFKQINENFGDDTCNQVLRQIAEDIKDYISASDIYGRFGTAMFLILRENMTKEEIGEWISDLFSTMQDACPIKGINFKAGIYCNVDTSISIDSICNRAILALNSAEGNYNIHYAFYNEKHEELELRLAAMEAGMREAYDNDQFDVYYQPKHDTRTGKLMGAEALIRWIHPEFGFLSPGEFIPLFERNGFISKADYYVLKHTCMNLRKWMDEGITPVPISVNLSRRDFDIEDCRNLAHKPLIENNIDSSLIHLEITESMFSDNMGTINDILVECRKEGFEIELDDFGSGYSSLTTVASIPLDVIKLDMSLIEDYKNEKKQKILSGCIGLAKSLGLKTVCEGVENDEQVALLQEYGCDLIQGYYFSKPLPEDQFREYLLKYQD